MFQRVARNTFYVIVYLSGILIGQIYTPQVVAYAKQMNEQKNVEKQQNFQKPPRLKKKLVQGLRLS